MVEIRERTAFAALVGSTSGIRVTANYGGVTSHTERLITAGGIISDDVRGAVVTHLHAAGFVVEAGPSTSPGQHLEPRPPAVRPSMREIFEETKAKFPVIMARLAE